MLHILLLTMIICCWSCGSGGEDVPTPTPTPKPEEKPKVEVTTSAPVLTQEGGTASVTFTSTAAWTIDVTEGRAVSWCTVSPTSGGKGTNTLTITTVGNDTYEERNAKVTIKAGATTQSFTITQKQKDGLTVTSNKVEVKAEGGDIAIEIKANVKYEYIYVLALNIYNDTKHSIPDTILNTINDLNNPFRMEIGLLVSLSTTLILNNFLPIVCPLFIYWNTT